MDKTNKPIVYITVVTVAAIFVFISITAAAASTNSQSIMIQATPAQMLPPQALAGFHGKGDQRDADLYPAVAFDAVHMRYLAVWQSVHNAGSRSDGFDVYGIFLGTNGSPIGSTFRISDRNNVARSSPPTVVANNGGFVVAWTGRGSPCRLYLQQVTSSAARTDQLLITGDSVHQHSPSLAYDATEDQYVVVYTAGDDYLPVKLFGTSSADCGDNANSTAAVKLLNFHFENGEPLVDHQAILSPGDGAALRPSVAYSEALHHYLVVWEDRRNAADDPWHFDVYGQRISQALTKVGDNLKLDGGGSYVNSDESATWTPRPSVAAGDAQFLANWYRKEASDDVQQWSLRGALVLTDAIAVPAFPIMDLTFFDPPAGNAPTGFVKSLYHPLAREYLVVLTSHTESFLGYFSSARVQRVDTTGQLLKTDGTTQPTPGVGYVIDNALDDQLSIGAAVNPFTGPDTGYLIVYGRHAPGEHSQDFDIWRGQILQNNLSSVLYLPAITNQ